MRAEAVDRPLASVPVPLDSGDAIAAEQDADVDDGGTGAKGRADRAYRPRFRRKSEYGCDDNSRRIGSISGVLAARPSKDVMTSPRGNSVADRRSISANAARGLVHGFRLPSCCPGNLGSCALAPVSLDPATGAERVRTSLRAGVPIPLVQAEPPEGVLSEDKHHRAMASASWNRVPENRKVGASRHRWTSLS